MKLITLLLIALLSTSAYSKERFKRDESFDRSSFQILTTVIVLEDERAVANAFEEMYDMTYQEKIRAFSSYNALQDEDGNWIRPDVMTCVIFVAEPRRVDDSNVTSLGHEMLHCIWGEYHD